MITMMAICIVKFTRLQKPVPKDTTAFFGPAPIDKAPAATTSTASAVNTKASGNQRSLHSVTANATRWSSPPPDPSSGDASPPARICAREVDWSDCFIASPVQILLDLLCRLQVRVSSVRRNSASSTLSSSDTTLLCVRPCRHLPGQIGSISPGHDERLRLFVGTRSAQNHFVGEFIAHQLQRDRQAIL